MFYFQINTVKMEQGEALSGLKPRYKKRFWNIEIPELKKRFPLFFQSQNILSVTEPNFFSSGDPAVVLLEIPEKWPLIASLDDFKIQVPNHELSPVKSYSPVVKLADVFTYILKDIHAAESATDWFEGETFLVRKTKEVEKKQPQKIELPLDNELQQPWKSERFLFTELPELERRFPFFSLAENALTVVHPNLLNPSSPILVSLTIPENWPNIRSVHDYNIQILGRMKLEILPGLDRNTKIADIFSYLVRDIKNAESSLEFKEKKWFEGKHFSIYV